MDVPREPAPLSALPGWALQGWALQDAKAKFSELQRSAQDQGPQRGTVCGREAMVVLAAEEYAGLAPEPQPAHAATLYDLVMRGPFLDEENGAFGVAMETLRVAASPVDLPE